MNQPIPNPEKTIFHFHDHDFCQLDLDTLNRLWPIIQNTPARKSMQKLIGYMELPELHQLELALILIRKGYLYLGMDEQSEKLNINLEITGQDMRVEPAFLKPGKNGQINS